MKKFSHWELSKSDKGEKLEGTKMFAAQQTSVCSVSRGEGKGISVPSERERKRKSRE